MSSTLWQTISPGVPITPPVSSVVASLVEAALDQGFHPELDAATEAWIRDFERWLNEETVKLSPNLKQAEGVVNVPED